MTQLRMISYNIHKGFTTGNRKFVLDRIRDAIRAVDADIVLLQEVMGQDLQFEYLADTVWPHYAYGKNAVYTTGHHGNAILSRYPLTFWENVDISTNRLERRGLLHGVIEIPHKRRPVHVICVHLGLLETERQAQIRSVCKRVGQMVPHDEAVILGGDFNDWRNRLSRPLQKTTRMREIFRELKGAHARTFPSWLPALKLDRIYYRGLHAQNARALGGRPWNQLSDHLALCADFVL